MLINSLFFNNKDKLLLISYIIYFINIINKAIIIHKIFDTNIIKLYILYFNN